MNLFQNEYLLDLDIKFKYDAIQPIFRRGDTSILKMRIHDNSKLYDINSISESEVTIIMPSGLTLREKGKVEEFDGRKVIIFQFEQVHMLEVGIYNIILTISSSDGTRVSVQPFTVYFFDSINDSDITLLQLIQDLQGKINIMEKDITDSIKIQEKGAPNGVATLDSNMKLTQSQVPDSINNHLQEKIYLTGAHKWRVDEQGMGQYETPDGKYQYIGRSTYSAVDVSRLLLQLTIADSLVTLVFSGQGSSSSIKWSLGNKNISYFMNNGSFVTGNTFAVDNIGMYTVFYNDELGNEYITQFVVTKDQIKPPDVQIYLEYGIMALITDTKMQLKKYDKGIRDLEYFENNGKMMVGNSVRLTETGDYTVYYKLENGLDYIQTFNVTPDDLEP